MEKSLVPMVPMIPVAWIMILGHLDPQAWKGGQMTPPQD